MLTHLEPVERYRAAFKRFDSARQPAWLRGLRAAAIERFETVGFPTTRDEEWRQTDVSPIASLDTLPAPVVNLNGHAGSDLAPLLLDDFECSRLVFVNGHYAPELSSLAALPQGVTVGNLASALAADNEVLQQHLGRYASFKENAFTALNTAFLEDGLFVHVSNGIALETPVHAVFLNRWSGEGAPVTHPRNLVVLGAGAGLRLIETYAGAVSETYFTNAVTEVLAGKGAVVDHYKVQLESEEAYHVATLHAQQDRDCKFRSLSVNFGGRLVRNQSNAVMAGSGIECTLNGLFLASGKQQIDNHTVMDHAQPNCNSHELYAGILGGQARGVFNGKIFVRLDAQKTDAKQSNRNLLLSRDAVINTKPQLEIFADDVKCTHGATIGQLDQDAIFYLRSRGIEEATARDMLIHAFAVDLLDRIEIAPLRVALERELDHRLARGRLAVVA